MRHPNQRTNRHTDRRQTNFLKLVFLIFPKSANPSKSWFGILQVAHTWYHRELQCAHYNSENGIFFLIGKNDMKYVTNLLLNIFSFHDEAVELNRPKVRLKISHVTYIFTLISTGKDISLTGHVIDRSNNKCVNSGVSAKRFVNPLILEKKNKCSLPPPTI